MLDKLELMTEAESIKMWKLIEYVTLTIVSVSVISDITSAFSTDPTFGKSACLYLYPSGHGAEPQVTTSPYRLVVSSDRYSPGQTITVTINSSPIDIPFRGFLLQARRVANLRETVGEFTASHNTKRNCIEEGWGGRTITHRSPSLKVNEVITWTAPAHDVGDIHFRATVVEAMDRFWANITSDVIKSPTSDHTTVTGADDISTDMEVTSHHEATTTTILPSPSQRQYNQSSDKTIPTKAGDQLDLSGCGVSKSCYRAPDNCVNDCHYVVTWRQNGSHGVNFELQGKMSGDHQYIALGLSLDDKMGDDNVTGCIYTGEDPPIVIQRSYNLPDTQENTALDHQKAGLSGERGGYYEDGYISCFFTWEMEYFTVSGDDESSDDVYHFLLATGPVTNGVKGYHGKTKIASSEAYKLSSNLVVNTGGVTGNPLVKVHGILMIVAWMVCASIAVLMPRYFKNMWPTRKCDGKDMWFQIHQTMMVSTLFLTAAGFVIIFVHAGGYADYTDLPSRAHPPVGIATTALVIINPIMAAFRPDPTSSRRPVFNFLHFSVGVAAHILSVVTMYIGVYMSAAAMPSWSVKIMGTYVVWHVLIEIALAVDKHCCTSPEDTSSSYALKEPGEKDPMTKAPVPKQNTTAKTTLAVLHAVGVLALALALIIPLALA